MKILSLLLFLCAVMLIPGCNTCKQDPRYISTITVVPDKVNESTPAKFFNVYVDLKKKTGSELTKIPLPPLAVTYDSDGLALVKINIEGMSIKYSVDVIGKKESYDVFIYKLDIDDGQAGHHEEQRITIPKDSKSVKSDLPAKKISEKENPEAIQKAIQNKTFTIKVDQDYYKPSECSIEWLFSYPALLENQYINLHFDIYDRMHNNLVDSFNSRIITGRKKGSFNLLISVRAPNSGLEFNFQDGGVPHQTSLVNIILVNQRIKSLINIETKINEKTLLARMEPTPSMKPNQPEYFFKDQTIAPSQHRSGREKVLNYDIYITPQIIQDEKTVELLLNPIQKN